MAVVACVCGTGLSGVAHAKDAAAWPDWLLGEWRADSPGEGPSHLEFHTQGRVLFINTGGPPSTGRYSVRRDAIAVRLDLPNGRVLPVLVRYSNESSRSSDGHASVELVLRLPVPGSGAVRQYKRVGPARS